MSRSLMIRLVTTVVLLAGTLYVGSAGVGPVPPLGPLLDPVGGVWSAARGAEPDAATVDAIPGLDETVRVLYDDRAVPHIFASTRLDAFRALGFVVARDRLFQLELQVRATEGTLTEWLGRSALEADRAQRRRALAWSAEQAWSALEEGSSLRDALLAYADGVNAFIQQLTRATVPLEYHLVGARPRPWRPQYGLYAHRQLGLGLSYGELAIPRADLAALVGWEAAEALLPSIGPVHEPVIPTGLDSPRFERSPIPPPGPPAPARETTAVRLLRDFAPLGGVSSRLGLGSNAWAVGPAKSASGRALLAGDPHLGLTLPSAVYEVHLVVPGEIDVYGVTFPGIPGVAIGFNRDVAWSFTNAFTDQFDLFSETVDDAAAPSRYRVDGEWRPLERRLEQYRSRSGRLLHTDTLLQTHRGPLLTSLTGSYVADLGSHFSLGWTVLQDRGESLSAVLDLQTVSDVQEWLAALARYQAPTQTGIAADRGGSIATHTAGRYPLRPGDGRGDRILDGSTSESDWTGDLALAEKPTAVDPEQAFLASANQRPVDPGTSDVYLGMGWVEPWRAMRINELLRASDTLTLDDFQRFHTDTRDVSSDVFVPAFLSAAERVQAAGDAPAGLARAAELLGEWDGRWSPENTRTVLFDIAMQRLDDLIWDELDARDGDEVRRIWSPSASVTALLLDEPSSPWWDRGDTPEVVERRDGILGRALAEALDTARERYGEEDGDGWRWERIQRTNIAHVGGLPSLGALDLPGRGGPNTVHVSMANGRLGPAWRMVVALGDEVRARTIYPGGQSGNPLSVRYRDRIDTWLRGDLEAVRFPHAPDELEGEVSAVLTLDPGGS